MASRGSCVPVSDKLPFCKIDAIALGVIVLTVFFLLFCLERIVRVVQMVISWARSKQRRIQSPIHSDSSSVKLSDGDDEKRAYEDGGNEIILPLHRCIERSASDHAQRGRPNLRVLVTTSISRSFAKVNISRPTLAALSLFAVASQEETNKVERRKLKDTEGYKILLDETACRWISYADGGTVHRSPDRLAGFISRLKPFIVANGYRFVAQLRIGDPLDVGDFIAGKDEAWKRNLAEALSKGFTEDQWDDFANLDIIETDPAYSQTKKSDVQQPDLTATAHSWAESYKGRSHELLWKHISNYYMKSKGSELYANMCAIVQSSGMGKSRAVNELGKTRFLIPMNLRKADFGYPPPDTEIRDYLTQDLKVSDQARGRCFRFLLGVFSQTLKELQRARDMKVATTKQEMIQWFHSQISPPCRNEFRTRFWADVLKNAMQHGDASVPKDTEPLGGGRIVPAAPGIPETSGSEGNQKELSAVVRKPKSNVKQPNTEEKARYSRRLAKAASETWETRTASADGSPLDGIEDTESRSSTADGKTQRTPITVAEGSDTEDVVEDSTMAGGFTVDRKSTGGKTTLNVRLVASAQALVKFLREANPLVERSEVEVVLAFDEAHVLCENVQYDITSGGQPWSMFYMLREAFRCLYGIPVWGLFVSTTGKLSQFNPHHGIDLSMRTRDEKFKSVPAFTTLRYDLFAPHIMRTKDGKLWYSEALNNSPSPPGKKARAAVQGKVLTLEQATRTEFLVRFGRPLFYIIWHHGTDIVRSHIIRFSMSKLICEDPNHLTTVWEHGVPENVAFACLSQRLCLEFNSAKYNTDEETQIASHMRLCLKIDPDNQFITSSAGSEPVLAEAAATIMQMGSFKAAESLKKVVSGFGVNKGDRGELVGLLAVTRARDLAVRKRLDKFELSGAPGVLPLTDEQRNPVFRAVTVMEFLSQLFSLKKMEESELAGLSADFEDAYVYFNHFVRPFNRSTCTVRYLFQYMTRGAAILCSTNMPGIDAAIGILFKSAKGIRFQEDQMSVILLQMKNGITITKKRDRVAIEQNIEHTARGVLKDAENPRPIIRMTFAFGSKEELSYSKSSITLDNGKSVTTHDFWCGGIENLLPDDDESKSSWAALLVATMKSKELFEEKDARFKEFAAERVYLAPGGSNESPFWGWIEETTNVMKEGEGEENKGAKSHATTPKTRSVEQIQKVESREGKAATTKAPTSQSKRKRA